MRQHSRKFKTETEPTVYIPPLNLSGNDVSDSPARPNRSKEHITFFKATPLDQNADFLKEKSLYRYAISRKGARNSVNKSQSSLLGGKERLNRTQENMEVLNKSMTGPIKQKSVISGFSKQALSRQRHFRRKTRNEMYCSNAQLPDLEKSVENNTIQKGQESQIQNMKSLTLKSSQSQSTSQMNLDPIQPKDIQEIRKELDNLRKDNAYLRGLYEKKCSQLDQMEMRMEDIKVDNDRLLQEVRRNCKIHSDTFINENKLENQLRVKDTMILQLKEKLKYLQLENITLKKNKSDKTLQEGLVLKLEKKNKNLEEKIRVLTRLRTKRHMTGSMMSEFSDMSLNLSADDEDSNKVFYPELRTAEKTPEKKMGLRRKENFISSQERLTEELLTPLWKPR